MVTFLAAIRNAHQKRFFPPCWWKRTVNNDPNQQSSIAGMIWGENGKLGDVGVHRTDAAALLKKGWQGGWSGRWHLSKDLKEAWKGAGRRMSGERMTGQGNGLCHGLRDPMPDLWEDQQEGQWGWCGVRRGGRAETGVLRALPSCGAPLLRLKLLLPMVHELSEGGKGGVVSGLSFVRITSAVLKTEWGVVQEG